MEQTLDVSDLSPPEPMERILEAIEALKKGERLRVIHRREPHMLYPMIEQQGFAWHTRPGGPAGYEIFIWRRDDQTARSGIPD